MNSHMKTSIAILRRGFRTTLTAAAVALGVAAAAPTIRAQTAANFTIVDHATGQPLSLTDYQGSVIVLDFWAYWCEYCQYAAADIEPNITRYYRNAYGNSNGVPVQVLSLNIDCSCDSCEDSYINDFGLEVVSDDCNWAAYNQWNYGGIPQFVVINGTTNSVNHAAWQVLSDPTGYLTNYTVPQLMKAYIDSVLTPAPVCVVTNPASGSVVAGSNVVLGAKLATNGKLIKGVAFYNGATQLGYIARPPHSLTTNNPASSLIWNTNYSLTWSNVPVGAQSVFARVYYGAKSSVDSAAVNFTVGAPIALVAKFTTQGPNLVLSWSGGSGNFQVQCATNLFKPSWQNIGAAGPGTNLTLVRSNKMCFYRVLQQ